MEKEEEKLLKITTLNVKNLETNSQYVFKLLRSSDILCLQETWLFNFQLSRLDELHKNFEGFGKSVDDNDPIPPTQKPRGYGGVATLFRKSMNLKVRKCPDGGSRIVVTEIVSDPLLCIINVYLPCRNSKATEAFEDILLELQEVLDKYTCTHAVILLGNMNSSLLNRGANVQDKKLQNFCAQNELISLQHGVPTFFHVNGDDEAEIDYILLNKKAKPLVKTVRVDNFTASNTSDHVPVYIILNIKAVSKNLKPASVKMKPRWENCNKLAYREYIAKYIPTFHYQHPTLSSLCPLVVLYRC